MNNANIEHLCGLLNLQGLSVELVGADAICPYVWTLLGPHSNLNPCRLRHTTIIHDSFIIIHSSALGAEEKIFSPKSADNDTPVCYTRGGKMSTLCL